MANNFDVVFEQMSEEDMGVIGAAIYKIQEQCLYCCKGVTGLLRSLAKELIICSQVKSACQQLPETEQKAKEDKEARLSLMTTKRQDIMQWNDLFHSRTRGICGLCQQQTQECVAMWKLGKRL